MKAWNEIPDTATHQIARPTVADYLHLRMITEKLAYAQKVILRGQIAVRESNELLDRIDLVRRKASVHHTKHRPSNANNDE